MGRPLNGVSSPGGLGTLDPEAGASGHGTGVGAPEVERREELREHRAPARRRGRGPGVRAGTPISPSTGPTQRLTRQQEVELARRIEAGDPAAREEFILANQGLIGHVLRTEFRGFIHLWDDLFQEGQVGLIKAVDRFDWRRGYKFSSYAVWWIRREIQLALGRWWTGAARIPESRQRELREFKLAIQKLADLLDRPPSPEEIAGDLGIPLDRVYEFLKMVVAGRRVVSFEAMEERGRSVMNLIADERAPSVEGGLELRLESRLRRVIGVALTEKQREVICLRYGLDLHGQPLRPLSQKEVAEQMDISPQAVSRIEERALARIRAEMDLITQPLRRVE